MSSVIQDAAQVQIHSAVSSHEKRRLLWIDRQGNVSSATIDNHSDPAQDIIVMKKKSPFSAKTWQNKWQPLLHYALDVLGQRNSITKIDQLDTQSPHFILFNDQGIPFELIASNKYPKKILFLLELLEQMQVKVDYINRHDDCAFCRIIDRTDPGVILYENDTVIAIEKQPPRSPVDCLVLPKRHIVNLKYLELDKEKDQNLLVEMMKAAQLLSSRLEKPQEYTVHINNGPSSSQTVFHMHMHFKSPQTWR